MDVINTKPKGFHSRHEDLNKLPKLKLQNLVDSSGWAEMSGPAIKAAGTRSSAPFFSRARRRVLQRRFAGGSKRAWNHFEAREVLRHHRERPDDHEC
eukprot:521470-Pyramimonas_sp.AAC.1